MSCEVSPVDVYIKEEPPCEEHDAAALRVRESQIKLELESECSDTQLKLEPADQEVQVELVKVEPFCEEHGASATGGDATQCSDLQLAQESAGRLEDSLYPDHMTSSSIILSLRPLLSDVYIKEEPPCEEHDDAALRVRESQIKLEPSECSNTQLSQDRSGQAGTSASLQDPLLIYEGHVVKGEELVIGPEVWQQPAPPAQLKSKESAKPMESTSHQCCNHSGKSSSCVNCEKSKNITHKLQVSFNTCDKKLSSKSKLLVHQRIHTGEKIFKCDICGKQCTQKYYLKAHLRVHSGEKPYTCDICNKKFTDRGTLRNHLRVHSDEKPYTCDICNNKFTRRSTLMNHLHVHSDEKPYTCDICNKKFTHGSTLTYHLQAHSREKPYTCDICKKMFTYPSLLKSHLRVHSGEKPYTCDICKKMFTYSSHLKSHLRVHSGEKPHACDICKRKFSRKRDLVRHQDSVHMST